MSNITFPLTFTTLLPYEIYNHQNANWNVNEYYLIVMELKNINGGKTKLSYTEFEYYGKS